MMQLTRQPEFTAPRDQDELEGTLLLPTATALNAGSNFAPGAVPTAHFEYAHVEAATADAQAAVDINDIPTAPLIPKFDNLKARENAELHKTALGQVRGIQQAEMERAQIAKADVETYAINYHVNRHVEEANRNARRRNMEGVEIEKDTWFGREKDHKMETNLVATAPPKKIEPAFTESSSGGYEVSEYKFTDYSTSSDYQVTEYKSVYD